MCIFCTTLIYLHPSTGSFYLYFFLARSTLVCIGSSCDGLAEEDYLLHLMFIDVTAEGGAGRESCSHEKGRLVLVAA